MKPDLTEDDIVAEYGGYLTRILNCLEEFHGKHGQWPTKLQLPSSANRVLLDTHLTAVGYSMLSQILHLIVSQEENGPLIAQGADDETLNYGSEGWSGKDELPKADKWLWGVSLY